MARGGCENSLTSQVVRDLFRNKFVVIIGDSIQRGIYKDLVSLLQRDCILGDKDLKAKGEMSFMNDTLIEGGVKVSLNNGTSYTEVRQYKSNVHLVRFYFVTRCFSPYVESVMRDLEQEPVPDLVIMNSCLWDMTRYGLKAITDYKNNLNLLFRRLRQALPSRCLMIWNTTLPISKAARGGFLVQEVEYNRQTLRMDVLEANYFARSVVVQHGFDVLDLHFWFRHMLHWRASDGIHWRPAAHRRISELLLSHVSLAWQAPFPPMRFLPHSTRPALIHHPSTNSLLEKIVERAEHLVEEQRYRRPRQAPVLVPYSRPGPYPLSPRCPPRRGLHRGHASSRLYSDLRGAHYLNQNRPHRTDIHAFQTPLFWMPENLCQEGNFHDEWTPYAEDCFRGPHRHQEYVNRWRYAK